VRGNGVVIDPKVLCEEIEGLQKRGYLTDPQQLRIDERAHLILPIHRLLDQAREQSLGERALGTTGRGIGPAYEDKAARRGVRMIDLFDEKYFREGVTRILSERGLVLEKLY